MRLFSVLVMMPIVATFGLANAQLSDNETISNEIGTNEIGNKQASDADKPVDLTVLFLLKIAVSMCPLLMKMMVLH